MNISLSPELENYIQNKVKSGLYTSVSEVVREALRLMHKNDIMHSFDLQKFKEEVLLAETQMKQGRLKDGSQVLSELKQKLDL